jgi:hypothetical protein
MLRFAKNAFCFAFHSCRCCPVAFMKAEFANLRQGPTRSEFNQVYGLYWRVFCGVANG